MKKKDSASKAFASFHTTFTFQIKSPQSYLHGDGLAFTFARGMNFAHNIFGGSLLYLLHGSNISMTLDNVAPNRLFAIELTPSRTFG